MGAVRVGEGVGTFGAADDTAGLAKTKNTQKYRFGFKNLVHFP